MNAVSSSGHLSRVRKRVFLVVAATLSAISCGSSTGPTSVGPPPVIVPTILSITPSLGAKGTLVTIRGSNFKSPMTVVLGGAQATNVVVVDGGSLTAVTPDHNVGKVDLVVATSDATSTPLPEAFEYLPVITSCQVITGSWSIHIVGTGSLTGQTVDADLVVSVDGQTGLVGTLTIHNPSQSCVAIPWAVAGTFNHADNSVTFTATSEACRLQDKFIGALVFPDCTSGSGTGIEFESDDETFNWTMTRSSGTLRRGLR